MDVESQWALTPYEMAREPVPLPPDDFEISVTPRFLESELSCAICLDILRNTRTTKECLHRFCDECISQALRSGNKECPNCRKKLVSMRSLRPDPLFDAIIRTIFPNRAELDKKQSQLLEKLNKNSSARDFIRSMEEGMQHQAEKRGTRPLKKVSSGSRENADTGALVSASTSDAGSAAGGWRESLQNHREDGIPEAGGSADSAPKKTRRKRKPSVRKGSFPASLIITPAKDDALWKKSLRRMTSDWKKRTVKVPDYARVAHVCRFILVRLLEKQDEAAAANAEDMQESLDVKKVDIYLNFMRDGQKQAVLLDRQTTLRDVRTEHDGPAREPLELSFVVKKRFIPKTE